MRHMKREILLINDNLDAGGVEKVLQSLATYLDRKGEQLTIWACNGDREALRRLYPAGVKFRKYPFWDAPCRRFTPKWFFFRFCRVLFERLLLKLKRWDVVIAVKEGPSMILASRLCAGEKIAWVHTDYSSFHWTEYLFPEPQQERACMEQFDHVICVSQSVKQSVIDTVGDPGCLRVLYSPVDYPAILRAAEVPAEDAVRPSGKPLLVSVGRLSEVKRYDMLINICRELSARHDFELWIVGGGEQEEALSRQLKEQDIHCVRLLGQKSNPFPYVACADWVISSSASESYGLAIQEALILGKPVLAAYCPAIAESLDPAFGVITGPSREALTQGLDNILSHPETAERLRANLKGYDKSRLFEARLEAIYSLINN